MQSEKTIFPSPLTNVANGKMDITWHKEQGEVYCHSANIELVGVPCAMLDSPTVFIGISIQHRNLSTMTYYKSQTHCYFPFKTMNDRVIINIASKELIDAINLFAPFKANTKAIRLREFPNSLIIKFGNIVFVDCHIHESSILKLQCLPYTTKLNDGDKITISIDIDSLQSQTPIFNQLS